MKEIGKNNRMNLKNQTSLIENVLKNIMLTKKINITFIFIVLLFLFNIDRSYAEGCKRSLTLRTNCIDDIIYIHIPQFQYNKKNLPNVCRNFPFKEKGLPEVGSIIHPIKALLFYNNLDEIAISYKTCELYAKEFKNKSVFGSDAKKIDFCLISSCMIVLDNYKANGEENVVVSGNELKIISYIKLKEGLFVLVRVLK